MLLLMIRILMVCMCFCHSFLQSGYKHLEISNTHSHSLNKELLVTWQIGGLLIHPNIMAGHRSLIRNTVVFCFLS